MTSVVFTTHINVANTTIRSENVKKVLELWQSGIKSPTVIAKETGLDVRHVTTIISRLRKKGILKPASSFMGVKLYAEEIERLSNEILAEYRLFGKVKDLGKKLTRIEFASKRILELLRLMQRYYEGV